MKHAHTLEASPEIRHLPTLLRDIADAFSLSDALALAKEFGGHGLYIPASVIPDHRIAKATSPEVMAWLVSRHARESVFIPLGQESAENSRVAAIRKAVADGRSTKSICVEFRISERSVQRARAYLRNKNWFRKGDTA